jgi:hypothetical protein
LGVKKQRIKPHFVRLDPLGVLNKEKALQRVIIHKNVSLDGFKLFLIKPPFGGLGVKKQRIKPHFVRLDPLGVLNKEKALPRVAWLRSFFLLSLLKASF